MDDGRKPRRTSDELTIDRSVKEQLSPCHDEPINDPQVVSVDVDYCGLIKSLTLRTGCADTFERRRSAMDSALEDIRSQFGLGDPKFQVRCAQCWLVPRETMIALDLIRI